MLTANAQTRADATLAWSTRPVNYPLYFLRDLFVISLIAIVASRVVRANVIPVIAVCVLVAEYNLDGNLILRTPMLIAFFIGAALAIYKVPLDAPDRGWPYFIPLLLAACVTHYYYPSENSGLLISILGGLTIWTLTMLVHRSRCKNWPGWPNSPSRSTSSTASSCSVCLHWASKSRTRSQDWRCGWCCHW
ncbi:hypothetical protein N8D56_18365 [Devosia sp. A8/3-2]|nr:hypothetical protein N8D56_18365 [Devosia sp. A8/3-2]